MNFQSSIKHLEVENCQQLYAAITTKALFTVLYQVKPNKSQCVWSIFKNNFFLVQFQKEYIFALLYISRVWVFKTWWSCPPVHQRAHWHRNIFCHCTTEHVTKKTQEKMEEINHFNAIHSNFMVISVQWHTLRWFPEMLSKPIQKIMPSTSILYLNLPSSHTSLFTYTHTYI